MFTQPADLADNDVAGIVSAAWGALVGPIRHIEYAAVGFGSYHWHAWGEKRWFVTVDDLVAGRSQFGEPPSAVLARLTAALGSARALRDAGLEFVIAPVPTFDGEVVHVADGRWAVAMYPFVDGRTRHWGDAETASERHAVLDRLAAIHGRSERVLDMARRDDLVIPSRGELEHALLGRSAWGAGPYGERVHDLLDGHAGLIEGRLDRYDHLAANAATQPARMVLTHGEPHAANTIETTDGMVLIDWDTALIAAPERDLWWFASEPSCLARYEDSAGEMLRADVLELYRVRWNLTDVSLFVAMFQSPHEDTADLRVAWDALRHSLDALRGPR